MDRPPSLLAVPSVDEHLGRVSFGSIINAAA